MWKPAERDFKKIINEKLKVNHFMHYLGFKITKVEAGLVEGELELKQHHMQQAEFLHGGVTVTIADIVEGFAAFTLLKKEQGLFTIDLRISYLNPGVGKKLFAKGYVIKAGKKIIFCESEIWMKDKKTKIMIAKSSGTFAVVE